MTREHERAPLFLLLDIQGEIPRLDEALTHSSFVNEKRGAVDYERLEVLGDAVLGVCVAELLIERCPTASVGRLSRMRAALVSTEALAEFARSQDLARFVRFGRGTAASGDAHQPKVMADVVESLVGALFLHGGIEAARAFTCKIAGARIEEATVIAERDPKSKLQELLARAQRDGTQVPCYRVTNTEGPDNDRFFEVEVCANGDVVGRGRGRSKKHAEQEAARDALKALQSPPEHAE